MSDTFTSSPAPPEPISVKTIAEAIRRCTEYPMRFTTAARIAQAVFSDP